jgi:Flp pilus assembly pilin Flp
MLTYLRQNILCLKTDRKGLETIEYAIMAAIVVAVAFVGYHTLFGAVSNTTNGIATNLAAGTIG